MRKKLLLFILTILFLTGCNGQNSRHPNRNSVKKTDVSQTEIVAGNEQSTMTLTSEELKPQINIYIENSGSMNGFINHVSEYQDAIQNMLAWLEYYYGSDNIKLHYINNQIIFKEKPDNVSLLDFAQGMLSPTQFKSNGNGASTNLNSIVQMILDQTSSNTISILLSDNIYSISGSQTVPVLLSECKNKTLHAFLNKSRELETKHKQSLSTTIIQLYSQFNGNYWDYKHPTGQASQRLDCQRPYYMCVIGENSLITSFNTNFNVGKMNGYKNKYVLTQIDNLKPTCRILSNTYKIGQFRKVNDTIVKNASSDNHQHLFALAVAVDLGDIPLSDDEKCNKNLYEVSKDYVVEEVLKISDATIRPIDIKACEGCTHIIVISTTNNTTPSLTISMKRLLPTWIMNCSSENDTHIDTDVNEQKKTFGLSYFINGIKDAYDKGNEIYFSKRLTINR